MRPCRRAAGTPDAPSSKNELTRVVPSAPALLVHMACESSPCECSSPKRLLRAALDAHLLRFVAEAVQRNKESRVLHAPAEPSQQPKQPAPQVHVLTLRGLPGSWGLCRIRPQNVCMRQVRQGERCSHPA